MCQSANGRVQQYCVSDKWRWDYCNIAQTNNISVTPLQVLQAAVIHLPVQQLTSHLLQLLILSLVHLPVQLVSHHLLLLILLVHLLTHQLSVTQASSGWPTPHTYRSLITQILTSVDHKCVLMEHFSVLVAVLIRMLPGHSATINLDPILVNLIIAW